MVKSALKGLLRRGAARAPIRHWDRLALEAGQLGIIEVRNLQQEARKLRHDLDRFLLASGRAGASATIEWGDLPAGTDWAWRPSAFATTLPQPGAVSPASGSYITPDLVLSHDLTDVSLVLAQVVNARNFDLPDHALRLETFAPPDADYIALSFSLPDAVIAGLDTSFVMRVSSVTGAEYPAEVYLRLNIEHGPNIEQELRHLDRGDGGDAVAVVTEFDLGFVAMNPRRLARIWLDVIVEKPGHNAIWLRDLVISRHRRADM